MTTTAPPVPLLGGNQLLTALKWLRGGRDLDFVTAALSVPRDVVEESAKAYGWPNREHLRYAIDELEHGKTPTTRPAPAAAPAGEAVTGLVRVRVDQLVASPNNPRERMTAIDELAESIRHNGLIQPIVVQPAPSGEGYLIVAGHRRHAAVQRLGWMHVEVLVRKPMRPDAELMTMLVENGQRAGLDPIEEARALKRLKVEHGLSDFDLAKKVGRSQQLVSSRLSLLALPIEQQEELRAGGATLTEAVTKARIAAGTVRPKGTTGHPHLGAVHPLADRAKSRCKRLKHKAGGRNSVGGMACGECWESVIRADERDHLHTHSARTGTCTTCGGSYNDAQAATG